MQTSAIMKQVSRPIHYAKKQVRQVRSGGASVLSRKLVVLGQRICDIPMIILAMPVVFVIRAIRPLVHIRFRQLVSSRIGHFALNTEVYLCERDAGIHDKDLKGKYNLDIFYNIKPICNKQLKKMWDRELFVLPFARFLHMANKFLPGGDQHEIAWRPQADRDIHVLMPGTSPHISFTAEEEQFGQNELNRIGMPSGCDFVCFHSRDKAYLKELYSESSREEQARYDFRDADIMNYIPAMEKLAHRGRYSVRMGAVVEGRLNVSNSKIIDYASNFRTDFLDMYMGSKCRFFIASTAGIFGAAAIFRRPVVWINYIPIAEAPTFFPEDLFIPKKLYLISEKRFLTFKEILGSDIGRFNVTEQYERAGIEVIENTPEEIVEAVTEMDDRVEGRWKKTEEDEDLQRRFWALFEPDDLSQVFLSRIGSTFLRENRELLK